MYLASKEFTNKVAQEIAQRFQPEILNHLGQMTKTLKKKELSTYIVHSTEAAMTNFP